MNPKKEEQNQVVKTIDFNFNLPKSLIAQYPSDSRGGARLLVYNSKTDSVIHSSVSSLIDFVPDNTLVVFNDSKVRKARLYGTLDTGAKIEVVFIRRVVLTGNEIEQNCWEVLCSRSSRLKVGKIILLPKGISITVVKELPAFGTKIVSSNIPISEKWFEQNGHIPLPPYIKREDEPSDFNRYQTIYSKQIGSAAAPTAGLHFTKQMLAQLSDPKRAISTTSITHHVGLGTFLPVRVEDIQDHKMHTEEYHISQEAARLLNNAKQKGQKILSIGTTTLRCLESVATNSLNRDGTVSFCAGHGESDIFIYPGYKFKAIDYLFTNFHTPESTLLMLVSALVGREKILELYGMAVAENYRFFSYGDATLFL